MGQADATLIALDYSQHERPFVSTKSNQLSILLIRLQVRGSCRVTLNGTEYAVGPGDLIVSQPGETYRLQIDAEPGAASDAAIDSADYYLFCEGAWALQWARRLALSGPAPIDLSEDILALWRRLVFEKRNLGENNGELLEYLLKALCLTLERAVRGRKRDEARSDRFIPYQIKRYVERHATEPLTLARIAQAHGVSVSTASHLFKATFGLSIMRYAVDVRLAIASERILLSGMPLERIAEASGFQSYPYFCRAFRARYHMPPGAYRARHVSDGLRTDPI